MWYYIPSCHNGCRGAFHSTQSAPLFLSPATSHLTPTSTCCSFPNCSPQYLYQPTSTFSWPDCHCCFMSLPVPARLHLFPSPFLFTLRLLATSVQPCRLCSEVCVIIFTNKSLNCSCLPQLSAFGSFYLLPCIHTHTHLIIRLLTCLFSYCFHKSIQPPTFLLPQSVTVSSLSLENKQGKTLNLVEKFW